MSGRDRGSTSVGRLIVLAALGTTAAAVVAAVTLVGYGDGPTTTAGLIGGLHRRLLVVAVPVAVLVEGVIVYAVWRFRDNDDREATPENQALELGWTVATGLVILFVGVASYQVLAHPDVTAAAGPTDADADPVELDVTAHQWYWTVTYPDEGVSLGRANRIVLPTDRPIRIRIGSDDVIHSFFVPRLGLKQDAIPGQTNVLRTQITEPGEYRLYCAEYCGEGHSRMRGTVEAVPGPAYRSWLAERTGSATGPAAPTAGGSNRSATPANAPAVPVDRPIPPG